LAALKTHPREQAENMAALARADRIYQEHIGPARARIQAVTGKFSLALERQEPREIARARNELNAYLDEIERGALSLDDV
jgi:molecular chaperone HscC